MIFDPFSRESLAIDWYGVTKYTVNGFVLYELSTDWDWFVLCIILPLENSGPGLQLKGAENNYCIFGGDI